MFLINCPYCGERDQSEFVSGGEAHIARPKQPTELNDDQWAEYLFMRKNIKGIQFERWNHAHGCRKWFNVARDTSNDKIEKISLANTKFYPGRDEFFNFCADIPSILVVPINSKAFILIGGWSTKCFTKSDEKWIKNWSKKINNIFLKNKI